MTRVVTSMIALLLAAILGVAGLVDSTADLLMLAPFATLLLTLLIGLYPGEKAIETLASLLEGDGLRRSMAPLGLRHFVDSATAVLIAGPLGSRGPPFASA